MKTLLKTLSLINSAGWMINYIGMVYLSFKDQTYSMAIIPLCCNVAWEIVYGIIQPSSIIVPRKVILTWLALNCAVMYAAIKFAPTEWSHAPLVMENLPLIFAIGVAVFIAGHLALAAELGPQTAFLWSARACQTLLSVGALLQLLGRGSTRGASFLVWFSRFFGSACGVVRLSVMYLRGMHSFAWFNSPLTMWCVVLFLLSDMLYGVCFYYIRGRELNPPV